MGRSKTIKLERPDGTVEPVVLFDKDLFKAFHAAKSGKATPDQLEVLRLYPWAVCPPEFFEPDPSGAKFISGHGGDALPKYLTFDELSAAQAWDFVVNAPWHHRPLDAPTVQKPVRQRDRMLERQKASQRRAETLVALRHQREDETLKDLIYVSRYLVAMSLPYSPTKERQIVKSARLGDGRRVHLQLSAAVPGVDMPYGSDRTLLHWLLDQIARQVRDALKTGTAGDALEQSRFVRWDAAADYLRDMGLATDSGKNYQDLRARYRRLSGLNIGLLIEGPGRETIANIPLIERADLPSSIDWKAEASGQQRLVELDFGVLFSRRLVEALMESAVPFPKEILRQTRKQSQLQDYWLFLAWRSYAAKAESLIPWAEVREQLWQQDQTERRVRARFKEAITAFRVIWPELQAEAKAKGLWIAPPRHGVQLIGRGSELKRLT